MEPFFLASMESPRYVFTYYCFIAIDILRLEMGAMVFMVKTRNFDLFCGIKFKCKWTYKIGEAIMYPCKIQPIYLDR